MRNLISKTVVPELADV